MSVIAWVSVQVRERERGGEREATHLLSETVVVALLFLFPRNFWEKFLFSAKT